VTLDPETAHAHLALSRDLRGARWEPSRQPLRDSPARFDASRCVLGRPAFAAGSHYWEVAVAAGSAWAVGVAKESVRRKGKVSMNPQGGIWAVGRCGGRYQALTAPATDLPVAPEVIGVFLDYEAGVVAFADAASPEPFFSFQAAAFGGERVLP
ncbi:BT1A1 protein, partial [Rhinopomastus cyanomelas]|nr:BT1A1 protein [Rhinopomastus cyanomelas]